MIYCRSLNLKLPQNLLYLGLSNVFLWNNATALLGLTSSTSSMLNPEEASPDGGASSPVKLPGIPASMPSALWDKFDNDGVGDFLQFFLLVV